MVSTMEVVSTTSLSWSPAFSIPFLKRCVGGQSRWATNCSGGCGLPLVLTRCRPRPKVTRDHHPSDFLSRGSSTTDLAMATCSWTVASCRYNGRRCLRRILMASSSSSSSPMPREDGPPPEDEDGAEEEEEEGKNGYEVERALGMDGAIPSSSQEFLQRVSSRAYDMRRHLLQTIHSSSYEVLDHNPWREDTKPVFVLTQGNNQLCTMKTRQSRSEVEKELGLLFSRTKWDKKVDNKAKHARSSTKFNMLVEDIREGVLVFEDESEASSYCELLQGVQKCEAIAELEVSSVFDICQKMRASAVLFRRGRTPPLPKSLEQNLRARKRSLEDQDNI